MRAPGAGRSRHVPSRKRSLGVLACPVGPAGLSAPPAIRGDTALTGEGKGSTVRLVTRPLFERDPAHVLCDDWLLAQAIKTLAGHPEWPGVFSAHGQEAFRRKPVLQHDHGRSRGALRADRCM